MALLKLEFNIDNIGEKLVNEATKFWNRLVERNLESYNESDESLLVIPEYYWLDTICRRYALNKETMLDLVKKFKANLKAADTISERCNKPASYPKNTEKKKKLVWTFGIKHNKKGLYLNINDYKDSDYEFKIIHVPCSLEENIKILHVSLSSEGYYVEFRKLEND